MAKRKRRPNAPRPQPATSPAKRPDTHEIAVAPLWDKYSTYPSNGLTPQRLAEIFREADAGDIMRQAELMEEMEEKDTHLFSQLQTRKNAVTGLDYEIIPFDAEDERDKEIAEFCAEQLAAIEDMEVVCMDLLDAIGKGIAVAEILWGHRDGRTVVERILPRHQKYFGWDQEDTLRIYTRAHPEGEPAPANKLIIHRYKARSGHPARAGVLRVCAWMYLFKNYTMKDWVAFCEVFGMPLRLGKYAAGSSDEDKAALAQALVQIGTDAAGIIPDGTSIDFVESSKTTSADIYERLARYCDEQMSKAVLGQTLTSDSGGGSYAQSKTHNEVRHDLTVADCKALAATLRRDLLRPLVLYNFGDDARVPYIRYDCEEAGDLKEAAEIYRTLACEVGLAIPTAYLYKKFSIPTPEGGEEVTQRATPAAAPVPFKTVANKAGGPGRRSRQAEVDALADAALAPAGKAFGRMLQPVLAALDGAGSLEDILELLEDKERVTALALDMDTAQLTRLLQRAMFLADLEGRAIEYDA